MAAKKKTHADTLSAIRDLHKQKDRLRTRLEAELADADAHAKELRDALAALDGKTATAAPRTRPRPAAAVARGTLAGKSMTDSVLAALGALKTARSADIIAWLEQNGKPIGDRGNFGSYLYKMKRGGLIVARGKKGAMKYVLGKE